MLVLKFSAVKVFVIFKLVLYSATDSKLRITWSKFEVVLCCQENKVLKVLNSYED